jgi:hypothetical protein
VEGVFVQLALVNAPIEEVVGLPKDALVGSHPDIAALGIGEGNKLIER